MSTAPARLVLPARCSAILFDLDGTISESGAIIVATLRATLAAVSYTHLDVYKRQAAGRWDRSPAGTARTAYSSLSSHSSIWPVNARRRAKGAAAARGGPGRLVVRRMP